MDVRSHWDDIYSRQEPDQLTWFEPHPDVSLQMIKSSGVNCDARILDVGGGTSLLVDHLLIAGFTNLGVLDVSAVALQKSRDRLGKTAERVSWIEEDVLRYRTNAPWALWHDRAVFHFLTEPEDRARYQDTLYRTVPVGGQVIISTFGPRGPLKCSGLKTCRYSAESLSLALGTGLHLEESAKQSNKTPSGEWQQFLYVRLKRIKR